MLNSKFVPNVNHIQDKVKIDSTKEERVDFIYKKYNG